MKNYIKPDLLLSFLLLLLLIPLLFLSYFSFLSCQTVALIHLVCQSLRFVLSSWLRTASAKVYKVENSPRAPVSSSFTASSSSAVAAAAVLLGKFRIMRKLTSQDFSIVYWRKNCAIINFLCYFAALFAVVVVIVVWTSCRLPLASTLHLSPGSPGRGLHCQTLSTLLRRRCWAAFFSSAACALLLPLAATFFNILQYLPRFLFDVFPALPAAFLSAS